MKRGKEKMRTKYDDSSSGVPLTINHMMKIKNSQAFFCGGEKKIKSKQFTAKAEKLKLF